MSNSNTRLVYSTDPKKVKCPRCGEYTPGCLCVRTEKITDTKGLVAKLRIEKAGRGGKSVSVLYGLPNDPDYLKDLTKKLKTQLGTGGTFKAEDITIEIQGDHRPRMREILQKMGFGVKG